MKISLKHNKEVKAIENNCLPCRASNRSVLRLQNVSQKITLGGFPVPGFPNGEPCAFCITFWIGIVFLCAVVYAERNKR